MNIQINERNIAPFATAEHARQVIAELVAKGWPATYTDHANGHRWQFETQGQFKRFEWDLEKVLDGMMETAGGYAISWACDCTSEHEECQHEGPCPEQKTFDEMTPARIRQEVQEAYPPLASFLDTAVQGLYDALWFGTLTPTLCGWESATGAFLKQHELPAEPGVKVIDAFAGLVMAASDDAFYECLVSGAGHELADLPHLPRCERCHGIIRIDCLCEEEPSE